MTWRPTTSPTARPYCRLLPRRHGSERACPVRVRRSRRARSRRSCPQAGGAASTKDMESGMGTTSSAGIAISSAQVPIPRGAMKQTRRPIEIGRDTSSDSLTNPAPSRPVMAGKDPGIGFRRPERILPSTGLTLTAWISMSASPGPHVGRRRLVRHREDLGLRRSGVFNCSHIMLLPPSGTGSRETSSSAHHRAERRKATSACRNAAATANTSSVRPLSTTSPRYMTKTRSQR